MSACRAVSALVSLPGSQVSANAFVQTFSLEFSPLDFMCLPLGIAFHYLWVVKNHQMYTRTQIVREAIAGPSSMATPVPRVKHRCWCIRTAVSKAKRRTS